VRRQRRTPRPLGQLLLAADAQSAATVLSAENATVRSAGRVVAYCLVKVLVAPAINIWVGLPSDGSYNNRFMAQGGGGFVGSVSAPTTAVQLGYAGATTDTGHVGSSGSFGMRANPETGAAEADARLQEDFGFRSEHLMSVVSLQLIRAFYGRPPAFSYWNGCSTGGRQGHAMAQRFPGDYDGILAGAPAIHFEKLGLGQTWPQVPMREEAGGPVEGWKLQLAIDAAVAACDAGDGVADGVLRDPRACTFDASALACDSEGNPPAGLAGRTRTTFSDNCNGYCSDSLPETVRGHAMADACNCGVCGSYGHCSHVSCPPTIGAGEHTNDTYYGQPLVGCPPSAGASAPVCLTPGEARAVNRIWDGPRSPPNATTDGGALGERLWYGIPRGASLGALAGARLMSIAAGQAKYWVEFDADWDETSLTYANFPAFFDKTMLAMTPGPTTTDNAASVSAFRDRGGKLLSWHGWADNMIMPEGTIDYFNAVTATIDGGDTAATQEWFRLFMAPGVGHCAMDTSPFFDAIVDWVEHGLAPETVLHRVSSTTTRPLCPHPLVAVWSGSGSADDAAHFECGANEPVGPDNTDLNRRNNERVFAQPFVPSGF
jgi:hypothetical protein